MEKIYCDNCGREVDKVYEVILADESGFANYCEDCKKNSDRKETK